MTGRRRDWCLALATIGLLAMAGGCNGGSATDEKQAGDKTAATSAGGKTKRIIFVTNGDDPFWDACLSGLNEGAKQHKLADAGLSVHRDVNNGTADGQIEKLRQYATQDDIVGLAISPIRPDNRAIVEEMKNLQKKGVKVITVDADVDRQLYRDARTFYIGTDNIVGGRALGTAAKALLEAKQVKQGGYVQFAGYAENANASSRMDGFKEKVGEDFTEKARMSDEMDPAKARDNVRNAILNHPDLVALVGIWAYNAPAITDVVTETNSRDKYVVATFDAQALAIGQMEKGNIDVMVVQNPFDMGMQTVRLMKAMIKNDPATIKEMFPNQGQPEGDIYTTGLRVVVPHAESPVKKELFDLEVVEYLLLDDFRAWLDKYGLTSS